MSRADCLQNVWKRNSFLPPLRHERAVPTLLSKHTLQLAAFAASASLATSVFAAVAGDTYVLKIDHTQDGTFTPVDESSGAVLNNGDPAYYHSGYGGDIARIYWKLSDPSIPTTPELYQIQWWDPGPAGFNTQFQPIESQYDGLSETYPIDSNIPWNGAFGTNHQWISTANDAGIGAWNSTGPGPHAPAGYAPNADGATGIYMWLTRESELYVKWDSSTYNINDPLQRVWSDLRLTEIPEPASLSTLGVGAAGLLLRRRKETRECEAQ